MKNTQIEWIGNIPDDWDVKPISTCFKERNEKVSDYEWEPLSVTKQGVVKQLETAAKSDAHDARKKVCKNDFVINSRSDRKQSCGVSPYDGSVSLINIVLENRKLNPKFVNYLLKNYGFAEEFYRYGSGIVADLWSTNYQKMKKIMIPIPPKEKQQKIVDFLDNKVTEIDSVIEKTKQTIEDYKKYKQIFITKVMTKGLNKDLKYKNIDFKWLPKIPDEWMIMNTLYALEMPITDGPHTTPELLADGIPFISAESVSCGNGKIDFSHMRGYISQEFYDECSKKYIPQKDDIYMIKSGATTGKVAIVDTNRLFTIWSPLAVFRCNKNIVIPKFLYYALQTEYYQKQIEFNWSFGTQQNIGMRVLEKLKIIIPKLDIQNSIIEYLDKEIIIIDNLIQKKENILEELEQYKKSLIYEYVTGKKEVI